MMFEATCNLLTTRTCASVMELPDDPTAIATGRWDHNRERVEYQIVCGFGATTDRAAFERHMKSAHPERCRPSWRRLEEATAGGWKVRPAFKAQTDKPFTKLMENRLSQCDDCGTWVETRSAVGGALEDNHDCREVTA